MKTKIYSQKLVTLFIILQPLLDVLTYFSNSKFEISVGLILRGGFLLYCIIYLLFFDQKNKTINYIFFSMMILYLGAFFLINCLNLSIFVYKLKFIFKLLFFPITLLFLIKFYNGNIKKNIVLCGAMIGLLMLAAQIFGNAIPSYESAKLGNSGWFFSANELSSMCAIIIPIVFESFINKRNKFCFIVFILLSFCMLLIGTKTAYLSIGLTLGMFILYYLVKKIIFKEPCVKQILITFVLLCTFCLITPLTYTHKNIYIQESNNISDLVLNGRDKILEENIKKVDTNNQVTSIFMGAKLNSKNNYEFERDFYTMYYNFGLFGIIIFFSIPIYYVIKNLIDRLKNKNIVLTSVQYGAIVGLLMALGISYIAGHTLMAPAVSIYIALLIVAFISKPKKEINKKVMFISSVGGHLTQLLELKPLFSQYNYVLITEKTDVTVPLKEKYKIQYLKYGSRKYIVKYLFVAIFNVLKSIYLFIIHDPDVIVTTGTHTAVPMCYIGWLTGKKVIYIESFAKRTNPTLTGKIVYPIATVFVVQWESMLKCYPKAQYWGGIY